MKRNKIFLAVALFTVINTCFAQEPTLTPSAVMPAQGNLSYKQLFSYQKYDGDPTEMNRKGYDFISTSIFKYGLRSDMSLAAEIPAYSGKIETDSADRAEAFGDILLKLNYRFYKNDFGPIDTTRAIVFAGIELPTAKSPYGSDSADPLAGLALTHINGRNGFDAAVSYKINTGSRTDYPVMFGETKYDLLKYDFAYLYRLSPAKYKLETKASVYGTIEFNGIYQTNGENLQLLGPGLLYEAHNYALEVLLQLPVWQDIDTSMKYDYIITTGFRLLF